MRTIANKNRERRMYSLETLEARCMLVGDLVINEFVADNETGLLDEDGDTSDWIEIYNQGDAAVDLDGWHLTDKASNLTKWTFPAETVEAGEFLVVFASNKDRAVAGSELHTDFQLDSDGEFLALVESDGVTIASSYSPLYPPQFEDHSYGLSQNVSTENLIDSSSIVKALVPSVLNGGDTLSDSWKGSTEPFDDSLWTGGISPVGYGSSATEIADLYAYWKLDDGAGSTAASEVNSPADDGTLVGNAAFSNANLAPIPGGGNQSVLDLDGVGDFVTTGVTGISGNNARTVSAWINTSNQPSNQTIVGWGAGGTGARFSFRVNHDGSGTDGALRIEIAGGFAIGNTVLNDGQWHHVAVTIPQGGANLGSAKLYVDGQLDGENGGPNNFSGLNAAASINTTASNIRIGVRENGSAPFDGLIDEVSVFDRDLSGAEILQLFNTGVVSSSSDIELDLDAEMNGQNSSAFLRIPFNVTDPSALTQLELRMNYDDGFVAYINGQPVAESNAPGILAWNSTATSENDSSIQQSFIIPVTPGLLNTGSNILAIQGLNRSAADDDFFIQAELDGQSISNDPVEGYFITPTPGDFNQTADVISGPLIANVTQLPEAPIDTDDIVITAEVTPLNGNSAIATLTYRVMYGAETTINMVDDGTGADQTAGDGVYTAVIPNAASAPGEMVRWYVSATDENSNSSRAPVWDPLIVDQLNAPEYFGTVIADSSVTSDIPILEWFLAPGTEGAARTRGGTRAGLFFNGQFYDNVFVRLRGGSSAGLAKNSYKFDFNRGDHFRYDPNLPKVEEINLNTTFTDKSYVRQNLAAEIYDAAGAPGFTAFPMRVQRNGDFFSVAMFVEQPDEDLLDREGLDPDGALYKVFNAVTPGGNVEKKTRTHEDNSDFNDFATNINNLSRDALRNYVFDNVNLPSVMNHMVATVLTQNGDQSVKNYYLYRDSDGTGEWELLPWDLDLTFGLHYMTNDSILDDEIWADEDNVLGGAANNVPISPSHPFVGEQEHPQNRNYNRLTDALLEIPEFRELYLRRLRTLMDEILQPPPGVGETSDDYILETRLDELETQLSADVQLDLAEWADPWSYGVNYTLAESIERIKTEYLAVRRTHLFDTHSIDNVSGTTSVTLVTELAAATALVPTAANGGDLLGTTWTESTFVESPAWQAGSTGVGYDRKDDFDTLINLDLINQLDPDADAGTPNVNDSVFIRIPFSVDGTDLSNPELDTLTLRMKYDDAFVAYINGVQVAASDNAPATPVWNSGATADHAEALTTVFENFVIDLASLQAGSGALVAGTNNVLSIHGLNNPANGNPGTSSDLLILPELVFSDSNFGSNDIVGIPHAQSTDFVGMGLMFGNIEHNPASGNQDEEFIEIRNPTSGVAIDISGWQVTGGVEHTFAPGTVIPAGGSIYISPHVSTFRARNAGPSGGQGLLVQGDYRGHISNIGETLNLVAPDLSIVDSTTTPFEPSDAQLYLRISELFYNPVGNDENTEFIEFTNISSGAEATTLDLTGVSITDGPSDPFVFDAGTSLAPGEFLVVVKDMAAFTAAYPSVGVGDIAGVYQGSLSNGGETVHVDDAEGGTVHNFKYEDGDDPGEEDWPQETDGFGFSLVIIDATPAEDTWDLGTSWRSSSFAGGSPAAADPTSLIADFNGDGTVDNLDLTILLENYGTSSFAHRAIGDADGDQKVGLHDLLLLKKNFGEIASSPAPAAASLQVSVANNIDSSVNIEDEAVDHVITIMAREIAIQNHRDDHENAIPLRRSQSQRFVESVDQVHETVPTTINTRNTPLHRARRGHRAESRIQVFID